MTICQGETPPGKSVGGATDIPVDDATVNDILKSNIERLVCGDGTAFAVVSIKSITKQIVAGIKYEITGSFKKSGKATDCMISIWYRSWLDDANEKTKIKADCGTETTNTKGDDGSW